MAYINLFVGRESFVKIQNNQIIIDDKNIFPVAEINCIMFDNQYSSITIYTMNYLIENNVTVIFCDAKHMPYSVLLPFAAYYKRLATLTAQQKLSQVTKRQLWTQIIKTKIKNQALCLQAYGKKEFERLSELSKNVKSGDSDNVESLAARLYFPCLFGVGFSREQDSFINSALNYGYAIVRSIVAKELAFRGFECAYGLFHCNQFNPFNLADDLMEVFRPTVDAVVFALEDNDFSPNTKKALFTIVDTDVGIRGGKYALARAVEMLCESLLSCVKGEKSELEQVTFIGTARHKYE